MTRLAVSNVRRRRLPRMIWRGGRPPAYPLLPEERPYLLLFTEVQR